MVALNRAGRRADALAQFDTAHGFAASPARACAACACRS